MYKSIFSSKKCLDIKKLEMLKDITQAFQLFKTVT